MKLFRLSKGASYNGSVKGLDGEHPLFLPGVHCPCCLSSWGTVGSIYPTILPSVFDKTFKFNSDVVPFEEFIELAARVQPLIGFHRPICPGTQLGPFAGKSRRPLGLWEWPTPWYIIMHVSLVEQLVDVIPRYFFQPIDMAIRRSLSSEYYELEVVASCRLVSDLLPPQCSVCGRFNARVPDFIAIDGSSYNPAVPIQRVIERPPAIIVNEELADKLNSLRISEISLTPVKVR